MGLVVLTLAAIVLVRSQPDWPFQQRNLATYVLLILTSIGLLLWWLFGSRVRWRTRFRGLVWVLLVVGLVAALFRLKGVTGDFVPIVEFRWRSTSIIESPTIVRPGTTISRSAEDFPQFLGPNRDGMLFRPTLSTNWSESPPRVAWRQPIGEGWSGFALVGERAITQEQRGLEEWISAYNLSDGQLLWVHTNLARYDTTIAGIGPRATPTVVSNRVYTLGATGILDCLDLATGRRIWTRLLTEDAACSIPEWGFAGSPWVEAGQVVVQAGGADGKSLLSYRADSGEPIWSGGSAGVNYSSPFRVTLAGKPYLLIFGRRSFVAHDPATGAVLWDVPFGTGMPLVANPIVVTPNRILITAGYNVGAELLEVIPGASAPISIWKSKRLKAKFANPVLRGGFVYGLDDGMLACLDVRDGSQRWKEGRYGHGQGLLLGELYLLMSEPGELILLRPTPDHPNELARFPVFDSKTWNPIAVRGDRLLARNDKEVACLEIPLASR